MKNNKKILIVEDELSLLNVLTSKFEKEGFTVLKAVNGLEGLRVIEQETPDIVLLDIIMPVMDGMTMLKRMKEEEWGKDIPVILLTNLSDSNKIAEATKSGVYDYLVKADWKIDDVAKKVKSRLGI